MKKYILGCLLFTIFPVTASFSYEVDTHAAITNAAFSNSVIASNANLRRDLDLSMDDIYGYLYYVITPYNVFERGTYLVNDVRILGQGANTRSPLGWTIRGAIREGDVTLTNDPNIPDWMPANYGSVQMRSPTEDDPLGGINREYNHFYDPVYDRALHFSNQSPGIRAIDWALGSADGSTFTANFTQPIMPDNNRRNHYTIMDAVESMYRAITGTSDDVSLADLIEGEDPALSGDPELQKEVRKRYWATTFRILGDVLHVLQDMGQPQNTRNDWYNATPTRPSHLSYQASYEAYANARATGESFTCLSLGGATIENPSPLNYTLNSTELTDRLHDNTVYNRYFQFFSTTQSSYGGRGDVRLGIGLADYSNRNFFTTGKNYGNTEYSYPSNESTAYEMVSTDIDDLCVAHGYIARYLVAVSGETQGRYQTALGLFSSITPPILTPDLEPYRSIEYTLTREIFDQTLDDLIPRTTAYSTALLDYFFRGRLDITDTQTTRHADASLTADVTIRNASEYNGDLSEGRFDIFYTDTMGFRKQVDPNLVEGEEVTNLANGGEVTLDFVVPSDWEEGSPFILVYKGLINNDHAVTAARFQLAETALLAIVSTDDYDENGNYRNQLEIWRSSDKGASWSVVQSGLLNGECAVGGLNTCRIIPIGLGQAYAVMGMTGNYLVLKTEDNGMTWQEFLVYDRLVESTYPNYDIIFRLLRAVPLENGSKLVSFDPLNSGMQFLESYDGGLTWDYLNVTQTEMGFIKWLWKSGNQLFAIESSNDGSGFFISYDEGIIWGQEGTLSNENYNVINALYDPTGPALAPVTGEILSYRIMPEDSGLICPTDCRGEFAKSTDILSGVWSYGPGTYTSDSHISAKPLSIDYLGGNTFIANVYNYNAASDIGYSGILVSEDGGITWNLSSDRNTWPAMGLQWNGIDATGVVTTDPSVLDALQ